MRKYNNAEREYLENSFGNKNTEIIAKRLKTTETAVTQQAYFMGLEITSDGNLISIKALANLLNKDFKTVKKWLIGVRVVKHLSRNYYKLEMILDILKRKQDR